MSLNIDSECLIHALWTISRWINVEFIWELFFIESKKKKIAKIGSSYIFFLSFLLFSFYFLFIRDICLRIEIFHFTKGFRSCFSNTKRTPQKKSSWKKFRDRTNSWLRKYFIVAVTGFLHFVPDGIPWLFPDFSRIFDIFPDTFE